MLRRLRLRDFRNFRDLDWQPAAGSQVLVGRNGAGKTSLLEAIYLLTTTRSFRCREPSDCLRHGAAAFHLAGEVGSGDSARRLELGWAPKAPRHRTLDGRTAPLAEHLAAQPILAWTAAESALLTGAPELRRRFIDRALLAAQPTAWLALGRCQQALRQKRLLLQRGGRGLEAWNDLLASEGAALAALRDGFVRELAQELREVATAGLPDICLELVYRPSPPAALEGAESLRAALERQVHAERERRAPLVGPQRDEIEIRWAGREARRVASAGERKAAGLLLLAAEARALSRRGQAPLILFDDADAELDASRLAAVWRVLGGLGGQLIATSSRAEAWSDAPCEAVWSVAPEGLVPTRSAGGGGGPRISN